MNRQTITSWRYWTPNNPTAHNIQIAPQNDRQFFGQPPGLVNHLNRNVFTPIDTPIPNDLDTKTYYFLVFLKAEKKPDWPGPTVVNEFLFSVLDLMGYEVAPTVLMKHFPITFTTHGARKKVDAETCVLYRESLVLLISRTGKVGKNVDPSQVIAKAIAVFQHNNEHLASQGKQPLESMTIPCITMIGTRPTFYKVPVTRALSDAVIAGDQPKDPTIVSSCTPPFPDADPDVGMDNLDYRETALRYFGAFRDIAKEAWSPLLDA